MKNLGHIDPKSFDLFQSNFSEKYEFSENDEHYDFARCQRPDGSFYGTSGQCRKGKDAGSKKEETPSDKLRKAAEAGNPATQRKLREKAKREADTKRMYERAQERLKEDAKPKKLKTDFRKDVEKAATKRKVADAKREERRLRDNELLVLGREKAATQKAARTELKKVENDVDSATRKAKRDPSKENKEALKVQLRRLREQERAIAKLDREMDKIVRERARIRDQNEKERMTPAQRAEQRRIEKVVKERG